MKDWQKKVGLALAVKTVLVVSMSVCCTCRTTVLEVDMAHFVVSPL